MSPLISPLLMLISMMHFEIKKIEESRTMPKWLVHTLHDNKLDAPLSSHTRHGSEHASYASNCYALDVLIKCDDEEPVSFDEAQNLKNWKATMQVEYDAIVKNDTWYLFDLPLRERAIGTKLVIS